MTIEVMKERMRERIRGRVREREREMKNKKVRILYKNLAFIFTACP